MRTFWIVQSGIGVAGIAGLMLYQAACGGTIVGGPGTGSGTGTGPDTDTETDVYTETDTCTAYTCDDTGPDTDTDFSCHDCACVQKSGDTPSGCADTCDDTIAGTTTPNFCNGAPALTMCQLCIAQRCGVSDPSMCN